jgi:hypothetical protein
MVLPTTERVLGHKVAAFDYLRQQSLAAEDAHVVGCHLDSCTYFVYGVGLLQDGDMVARLIEAYGGC